MKRVTACRAAGNCVEARLLPDGRVEVRSTLDPYRTVSFTAEEWDDFITGAREGRFDRGALGR